VLSRFLLFVECLFKWKQTKPQGDLLDADCIIVLSFGRGRNTSGYSNSAIASIVRRLLEKKKLPILAQCEIADFLNNGKVYSFGDIHHYWTSWDLLSLIQKKMKENNWSKPVLVIHPWQLWRVIRHCERLNIKEVIIPLELEHIHFDCRSVQLWIKNPLFWLIREIPGRIYYFIKGMI
jgi:hypothetical protein